MHYNIRKFRDSDLPELEKVYRASIRHVGKEYYSEAQIEAWQSYPDDMDAFANWIRQASTYVAVENDTCVGFSGFQEQGRISSLFVAPGSMRRGIASALLEQLLQDLRVLGFTVVTTEASEFSRPVFEKYGFNVTEIEHTEFKGEKFTRYAMQARISQNMSDCQQGKTDHE